MSNQPAATSGSVQPVVRMMDDVVNDFVRRLPFLAPVQVDLKTVAVCWLRLVRPPAGKTLPRDKALGLLKTLMKLTPAEVREAVARVAEVVDAGYQRLADEFEKETGTRLDLSKPIGLQSKARRDNEFVEQEGHIGEGTNAVQWVTAAAAGLGTKYADPSGQLEVQPVTQDQSFRLQLRVAAARAGLGRFINLPSDVVESTPTPDVGFLTDPLLRLDSEDLTVLQSVRDVMDMYPGDMALVKSTLADFGQTDETLAALFTRVVALCRDQISQSETIKVRADQLHNDWVNEAEALDDLSKLLNETHDFFSEA